MKKIVLFFLLLALTLTAFSVVAFASDTGAAVEATEDEGSTENGTETPAQEATANEEGDFFTALYQVYCENRGELFSLLSAVVSLVLVFVYQKGLLPVLRSGIGLIEGQVKGLGEINRSSKEYNERVGEEALALATKMQSATEEMRTLTESLLSRTEEGEKRDKEFQRMRQCILWQAKLLGEVFLSSSLPEYSKERVGRVVQEVETMLAEQKSETE